jgi:hypothetical protein
MQGLQIELFLALQLDETHRWACRGLGNGSRVTLIDMPWKIMSIGLREWAHGF